MKITPYLETANRDIGYGPVAAAPGVAEHAANARTYEDGFHPGVVVRREVHTPEGVLTFFSRIRPVGEAYLDGYGRPIRRIDGICVANDPDGRFVFHPHYLKEAERINTPYFDRFWPKTVRGEVETIPEEIEFQEHLPEQAEGMIVREPYGAPKKNQRHGGEPGGAATKREGAEPRRARGPVHGPDDIRRAAERDSPASREAAAASWVERLVTSEAGQVHGGKVAVLVGAGLVAGGGAVAFLNHQSKEKQTETVAPSR